VKLKAKLESSLLAVSSAEIQVLSTWVDRGNLRRPTVVWNGETAAAAAAAAAAAGVGEQAAEAIVDFDGDRKGETPETRD
jgi:hypothetical protein